ncbi:MAG: hypothetical protein E7340_04705 [Clostridiales bacterium]|nr:hypothetical protein [Clostridiales bacterium]
MSKQKPRFYVFLKKTVAFFYGKKRFEIPKDILEEPTVIVGNHTQMHGPLMFELYYPKSKKIWCIGQMMDKKEIPEYAMQDFWPYKDKGVRWFYKLLSRLMARPLSYIFNNADCIAVYKDARIMGTLKKSVYALKEGEDLVIFPEKRQAFNDIINEFQDNFVDVARLYYKNTNKELAFTPAYVAPKLKKVVLGEPIKYNSSLSSEENKKIIIEYLKEQITAIAKSLPTHTVIPYENIKKKYYKKSK